MERIETFGQILNHVRYLERQGVYAVILDRTDRKVAVVRTSTGYFLPGGGIEGSEQHEECLARECLEETGYEANIQQFIGRAKRYFYSTTSEQYMVSDGFFYLTELVGPPQGPVEADHELVWIDRSEAVSLLFHEHQAWAVERAFNIC